MKLSPCGFYTVVHNTLGVMQSFEVQPLFGVGPIRLGSSREEVLRVMGKPSCTFKKNSSSQHPTDAWLGNGFQVFYAGEEPAVEYIELSRDSGFHVMLFNLEVFSTPASLLIEHLQSIAAFDPNVPELGYTYTFPSIELSFWRPNDEDPTAFSTVGVGTRGYFTQRAA